MKKFFSLFVCIVIMCSASSAYASINLSTTSAAILGSDAIVYSDISTKNYFPVQTCYVNVVLVYEQPNGTQQKVVQQIPAYNITYKVTYSIGTTGKVLGGFVSEGDYPKLRNAATSFPYDLDLSLTRVSYPTRASVTNLGDQYEVYIGGGSYTVTYNDTFYFDMYGNLVDTNSTTVTRAYYYEETKTQPYSSAN